MLMIAGRPAWNAQTGGGIRITQIAHGLSKQYDLTFLTHALPGNTKQTQNQSDAFDGQLVILPLQYQRHKQVVGLLSHRPYACEVFWSSAMYRTVKQHIEKQHFDLIYCHGLETLQFVPKECSIPIILDQQNVERQYWQSRIDAVHGVERVATIWNLLKTIRYEQSQLRRISAYVSVCESDRKITQTFTISDVKHFLVAPNGVDVTYFTPQTYIRDKPSNTCNLVFLGSMHMFFNVEAAERLCYNILPLVRQQLPGVTFRATIIGQKPEPKVYRIAEQDPLVTITGTVPDVRPHLQAGDIFVAPLNYGAGTKLKVVAAMASKLPVVGSIIALEGLDGVVGEHYLQAESDQSFADAICDLVVHPQKRETLGRNGWQLVDQRFRWRTICEDLATELSRTFLEAS